MPTEGLIGSDKGKVKVAEAYQAHNAGDNLLTQLKKPMQQQAKPFPKLQLKQ